MRLIEKESGLQGLVVRPLCAQVLEPSIPEEEGWVDRDRFQAITGRRRLPQMELAETLGIGDYPCPAGGCRLTEPSFAARMRDLLEHNPEFSVNDVLVLRAGRHFRLSPTAKAIVGRDEEDNKKLLAWSRGEDALLEVADVPGPLTVVRGQPTDGDMLLAAAITAWYSKARHLHEVKVVLSDNEGKQRAEFCVAPAAEETLAKVMITSKRSKRRKRAGTLRASL